MASAISCLCQDHSETLHPGANAEQANTVHQPVRRRRNHSHLDLILQRLSTFIEKIVKLKRDVISAMIYPAAVIVLAMRKANFTGKSDTDKLVSAFETLTVKQGPDFPDGDLIMNKDDHQGRVTYYMLKINGQKEEVVQTFPADQLPLIGACKIQ